jgi:ketosteroid isomerase-like protein
MSQRDVEVVRQLLERFADGEVLWDALDDDVVIDDHDILDASAYRGHAGVARWIEDWGAGFPTARFDVQELIDAGDAVVAVILLKARGRGSDVDLERQDAIVYRLRGHRVVRFDYYNSRQQALDALGLRE